MDRVIPASPAQRAGLRRDDLIIKVGDRTVHTIEACREALGAAPPGGKVTLTVKRGEEILKLVLAIPEEKKK